MPASEFKLLDIPEWYRTERETEKIIERLGTVKELDFYLKNPDEYIRRLAILRLQRITDKESVNVLKELMDDPAESGQNKYLAAWILKSVSKKWAGDIFLSSRYLGDFSGNESFDELFGIKQDYYAPSAVLNFTSSPSYRTVKLDSDEGAYGKDAFFETEFDFKKWSRAVMSKLLKDLTSALRSIARLPVKLPVLVAGSVCTFLKRLRLSHAEKSKQGPKPIKYVSKPETVKQKRASIDIYGLRSGLNKELNKRPGAFTLIKRGLYKFLYYLLSPVRLVRRHKLAVFCLLLVMYSLLVYTDPGRRFAIRYMSVDLKEVQDNTVKRVKEYSSYALNQFNSFLGINETADDSKGLYLVDEAYTESPETNEGGRQYHVTAKDGLNIRKLPDPSSERVGESSLAFGSTVTYFSKSMKDDAGRLWYYVKTKDGRAGWVSAIFLEEGKEG